MPQENPQQETAQRATPTQRTTPVPLADRTLIWAQRLWRPAGTVIAVVLALLVTWHVIYGRHGVSVWQQKRAEDRALQQENQQMRQQVQRLQSDPEEIEREAREKLHYAKPGDVIVSLPARPQGQQQPAGK